jgi:uncharacterized RDD family membrane protein YckC
VPTPRRPDAIVTPEAVVLEFETAGMGSRLLAAFVDSVIQLVLLVAVLVAAAGLNSVGIGLGGAATGMLYFLLFLLVFGYPAGFETLWRGRTPGKAALGLRVVTVEGGPIRFRHAAIRAILGLVDKYLLSATVGVLALLLTRRNQRLGDLAAGSLVLRERVGTRAPRAVAFAPPRGLEGYTASLDVAALGEEDYVTVRSFLLRAADLAPAVREAIAGQLARPIAERLRATPPAGVPAEVFLACVAAAHQRRNAPAPTPIGAPPAFTSVWSSPEPTPRAPLPAEPAAARSETGFTAP